MSTERWALVGSLATFLGMRLVDQLLPPGRRLTITDRYTTPNTPTTPTTPEEDPGETA